MYYVTVKQPPIYHQISLDEFLFGDRDKTHISNLRQTATKTHAYETVPFKYKSSVKPLELICILEKFAGRHAALYRVDRKSLYYEFYIPKKSGGYRKIDAPNDRLKTALYELKEILENDFLADSLYHTSAYAYVKGRSCIEANDVHIGNKSEWYGKLDLSNFFGSTTKEFVMKQLSMIFPFCEVCASERGREALSKAIDLGFLDGGLPQGTPLSPLLTNIIMIPIDFTLSNKLRDYDRQRFIYTRYADDFTISSRYNFDIGKIIRFINDTFASFDAPYQMKAEKTRYGSASGRNWNLGVMITKNRDGDIVRTIGSKRKRQFEAQLSSFALDTLHNTPWSLEDVRVLNGYINYYKNVEGEVIDRIIAHIGGKYNVNIPEMIRERLRA